MKSRVSQLPIKDRKGNSIVTCESTQPTPTKQMSPRSPKVIFRSNQTNSLIFPTMEEKKQRIIALIEENQRLKEENSVQDLVINTLQRMNEEDMTRMHRVKTLNSLKPNVKNGDDLRQFQKIKEKSRKEDNLLFTFFSPQSQPRSSEQFKLPKVFNVVPFKNKFFV